VTHAFERSYRPDGIARQFVAGIGPPGLGRRQSEIGCPTLVMHGGLDPLWGPEHAEATASQIPATELWIDPRQGHITHREQWIELADRVATLAR